jgi:hypothetical protein
MQVKHPCTLYPARHIPIYYTVTDISIPPSATDRLRSVVTRNGIRGKRRSAASVGSSRLFRSLHQCIGEIVDVSIHNQLGYTIIERLSNRDSFL